MPVRRGDPPARDRGRCRMSSVAASGAQHKRRLFHSQPAPECPLNLHPKTSAQRCSAGLGLLCDVFDRLSSQFASSVGSVEVSPISPARVGVEDDLAAAVPAFGDELTAIALWAKSLTTRLGICPRHDGDRNSRAAPQEPDATIGGTGPSPSLNEVRCHFCAVRCCGYQPPSGPRSDVPGG